MAGVGFNATIVESTPEALTFALPSPVPFRSRTAWLEQIFAGIGNRDSSSGVLEFG
jgi:hypothetical protein